MSEVSYIGIYIDMNADGTIDDGEEKWMDDYLMNEVKDFNDKSRERQKELRDQLSFNDEDDSRVKSSA